MSIPNSIQLYTRGHSSLFFASFSSIPSQWERDGPSVDFLSRAIFTFLNSLNSSYMSLLVHSWIFRTLNSLFTLDPAGRTQTSDSFVFEDYTNNKNRSLTDLYRLKRLVHLFLLLPYIHKSVRVQQPRNTKKNFIPYFFDTIEESIFFFPGPEKLTEKKDGSVPTEWNEFINIRSFAIIRIISALSSLFPLLKGRENITEDREFSRYIKKYEIE